MFAGLKGQPARRVAVNWILRRQGDSLAGQRRGLGGSPGLGQQPGEIVEGVGIFGIGGQNLAIQVDGGASFALGDVNVSQI